jgi:hypothetical protein
VWSVRGSSSGKCGVAERTSGRGSEGRRGCSTATVRESGCWCKFGVKGISRPRKLSGSICSSEGAFPRFGEASEPNEDALQRAKASAGVVG